MLIQRHRVKTPVIEEIQAPEPVQEEVKEVPAVDYDSMTKAEIIGALKKADIEFDGRQKKEELIELLKASK